MTDMDQGNSGGSPSAEKVTPAKMDAALKAKWVEALRSGKYQQAKNYLRRNDSYCCLGVLCDISGLSNWDTGAHVGEWFYGSGSDKGFQYLPYPVRRATNLSGDDCDPLMAMNDDGKSFSEIADYIEANL